MTERAKLVVGADGRHSLVAEAVRPEQYNERPPLLAGYYTYWSGLPMDGRFETYIRAHRGFAAAPTHDGLTLTVGGWPYAEFEANKKDVEGNFLKMFDLAPEFAERVRGATREAPFAGAAVPNFFRKPYGPGWALVGDAGYNKDPITAQGITDAFRDAELCATALDQTFTGARSFDDAMGDYQRTRDQHVLPMYEFTCQLATLEPPPPEMQQLFGAIHGNQTGHGRLCPDERGDDLAGGVLLAGEHRRDHGGRARHGRMMPAAVLMRVLLSTSGRGVKYPAVDGVVVAVEGARRKSVCYMAPTSRLNRQPRLPVPGHTDVRTRSSAQPVARCASAPVADLGIDV